MATPFDPPQARPSIFPQSRMTRYGFAPLLTGVTLSVCGVPPRAWAYTTVAAIATQKPSVSAMFLNFMRVILYNPARSGEVHMKRWRMGLPAVAIGILVVASRFTGAQAP